MAKKKNELRGLFWCFFVGGCFVLMILVAIGFAMFSNRKPEVIEEKTNGGNVILKYSNNFPGLTITEAIPMSDEFGMISYVDDEYFDFSVETIMDNAPVVEYEISVFKDSVLSTIPDDSVRIYLEKEESGTYSKVFDPSPYQPISKKSALGSDKGSMVLFKIKKMKNSTDNYRLRVWLSDSSLITTGDYSVKVIISGVAKEV